MKYEIFAVYDSKGEFYGAPQFRANKGTAIRDFMDVVKRPGAVADHPEDYTLFHIGSYDDQTGRLEPLPTPLSMGVAIEFVKGVDRVMAPHPVEVVS